MNDISVKDLKYRSEFSEYQDGYRIVYFHEDNYSVGAYCKTIEGFMIGFSECDPIMDESDIPAFISVDDILERSLKNLLDVDVAALYKTDGTLIAKTDRTNNTIKN